MRKNQFANYKLKNTNVMQVLITNNTQQHNAELIVGHYFIIFWKTFTKLKKIKLK